MGCPSGAEGSSREEAGVRVLSAGRASKRASRGWTRAGDERRGSTSPKARRRGLVQRRGVVPVPPPALARLWTSVRASLAHPPGPEGASPGTDQGRRHCVRSCRETPSFENTGPSAHRRLLPRDYPTHPNLESVRYHPTLRPICPRCSWAAFQILEGPGPFGLGPLLWRRIGLRRMDPSRARQMVIGP